MRTKERVREYADKHPTATVREIQAALGLSSPSVVQFHLKVDSKGSMIEARDKRIAELEAENARLHDELHAIKYEIMGGEDVPGSASAVTLEDIQDELKRRDRSLLDLLREGVDMDSSDMQDMKGVEWRDKVWDVLNAARIREG